MSNQSGYGSYAVFIKEARPLGNVHRDSKYEDRYFERFISCVYNYIQRKQFVSRI